MPIIDKERKFGSPQHSIPITDNEREFGPHKCSNIRVENPHFSDLSHGPDEMIICHKKYTERLNDLHEQP